MAWSRRTREAPASESTRPLIDPDPLRTPDDAYETGLLVGMFKNAWEAIAVKNLKDRRIARGEPAPPAVHPAGEVAGEAAGHPPTDGVKPE